MNLEMKLRAWDKLNNRFVTISDISFYPDGTIKRIRTELLNFGDLDGDEPLDDVVIIQYTGLKDKNGIEIYESDTVEMGGFIYVVEYSNKYCGYRLNPLNGSDTALNPYHKADYEVIGNIYDWSLCY